jgi:opacity protein-like surface antigen
MKGSIPGLIAGIAVAGIARAAGAADLPVPDLFTPSPVTSADWSGFYLGGQVAYTHANLKFDNGASDVMNNLLASGLPGSPGLAAAIATPFKAATAAGAFGAYIGYNTQWESVILGVEGNYNRTSINPFASQTVQLALPNLGTATASSAAHLTDYATIRARAGYIMGRFLPYAMFGLAIGRANFADSARLQFVPVINGIPQPFVDVTATATQSSTIGYGYMAGVGVDVLLMSGLFLRAEYEFIQFTSFGQFENIAGIPNVVEFPAHGVTLNSLRLALGYKF